MRNPGEIQVALYRIAGATGLAAGAVAYVALHGSGMERDAILSWSWTACFAALVPAMRMEIVFENRTPVYRTLPHWLRVVLFAGGMYYFEVHDQLDPLQVAAVLTGFDRSCVLVIGYSFAE